jgi:uncharacterized membrane protein YdbT with pleckstrin-like domain
MPVEPHGYLKKVLAGDETILYVVRQHSLFLWGRIIGAVIAGVLILAAVWALQSYVIDSPQIAWGYLLVLMVVPTIWWRVLVWRNHQYVVTSRRVMQLSGVLTKVVIDSLLEKVNDLKTDQSLLGRLFGYGDIEILTASEAGINDFRRIANPLEFKRAILEAKERLERGAG